MSHLALVTRWPARLLDNSLYRNSVALMANTAINAGLGFVFWVVVARHFAADSVGVVTTTMSSINLLGVAACLGLPNALVPLLARGGDQRQRIITALAATQGSALLFTLICCATPLRPPAWEGGWHEQALVLVAIQCTAAGMVLDASFIAIRQAHWLAVKNLLVGITRVALLAAPMSSLSAVGHLLAVQVASICLGLTLSLGIIVRVVPGTCRVRRSAISDVLGFTAANYVGLVLGILPTTLTPVLVLRLLGPAQGAYFSVCLMLLGLLNVIAGSMSQSLFAETGNAKQQSAALVRTASRAVLLLLIPATASAVLLAPVGLAVFGDSYRAAGTASLRWMFAGALCASISYLLDASVNGRGDGVGYLFLNAQNAVLVVVAVWLGAGYGLTGVGIAWCAAQTLSAVISGCYVAWSRTRTPDKADSAGVAT